MSKKPKLPKKSSKNNTRADLDKGKKRTIKEFKHSKDSYTLSTPEQAVSKFDKMKKAGTLKQKRLK